MDHSQFAGALRAPRAAAPSPSRRALGRALAGVAGAGLLARLGLGEGDARKRKKKKRCRNGQAKCAGRCTNVQSDPRNCGACGNDCGEAACGGGRCVTVIGQPGSGDRDFDGPRGVAAAGGRIAVADFGNDAVKVLEPDGGLLVFGGRGAGDGQFDGPSAAGFAVDGRLFVVDTNNHRIQRFTAGGGHELSFGSFGDGREQFTAPRGIFVEAVGNVWVVDSGNNAIKRYNLNMTFADVFSGNANVRLSDPSGLVVGANRNEVFVTDTGNDRVVVFDRQGNVGRTFGESGSGRGQFRTPRGIAVGADGNLLIADAGNDRVQIFTPAGEFVEAFGFADANRQPGSLTDPDGVAVTADGGSIVVAERGAGRLSLFRAPS